ncbi:DUF4142 domain-containing protein [Streptosporangium sp. V21-05]|uniref:DUF4142 domain-containing protein n=1 Tax=Streptosporangium sp. V21-05 TaxID=3446115 RepID=UPI003F532F2C
MVRMMIILLAVVVAAMAGTAGATALPTPLPLSSQDRDFLIQAHQGSLSEIEAGLAVRERVGDDGGRKVGRAIRELGEQLIADHTRLDKVIRRVAGELGVKLPDEPSAAQREQLGAVMALRGAEFDRAWISMEIDNHRQALVLIKRQVESDSATPQVRSLALTAERVVRKHLNMFHSAQEVPAPSPSGS